MLTIRLAFLAAMVTGLLVGPTSALASSADAAATQTYVHANYALVQAARSRIPSAEAALASVLGQVRSECPKAAAHSPQDRDSEQLSDEVVGAMVVAGIHPNVTAIKGFVGTAGGLHWSSHKLTSTIQGYTRKLQALSSVGPPNLCGDVKAWVASGYQTLPASTVRFDAQYTPVWVALGELPSSLHQFERAEERGLLARSNQLESQLTEYESRAVETYAAILDALELNQ
jgi:hypothetical protein